MEMEVNDTQDSLELSYAENSAQERPGALNKQDNTQESPELLSERVSTQESPEFLDEEDIIKSEGTGIFTFLDDYGSYTIITENALAKVFGCHPITIKRRIKRGELPPSCQFMGKACWTVKTLRQHIDELLLSQAVEFAGEKKRISKIAA